MKQYVIDTSSLIELMRTNPIDIYVTVWEKLEKLVNEGRLVAPIYVLDEIHRMDDELKVWANRHRRMFKPLSEAQIKTVSKVLVDFPGLSNSDKEGQVADPFVIAVALEKGKKAIEDFDGQLERIVITEEKIRGDKHRIPLACQHYKIKCMGIHEMFREEGWKF